VTLRELLDDATARLEAAGIESARTDAEWMAACVLGERRSTMLADPDREIEPSPAGSFGAMLARRARREPLAYIVGTVSFRGLELEVGPGTLVPRPETEVTAARAIERTRARGPRPTVVDVGTGCGAIALSIGAEVPEARIFATESSGAARGWALRNLARTGLRCTLLPGDLLSPLHPALGNGVDIVVSNPPYVSDGEWKTLMPEVCRYEPKEAVVGGPTGMEVIDALVNQSRMWLAPGGWLVLEVAPSQTRDVTTLLLSKDYDAVTVTRDLAGRERVVEARWGLR